MDISLITSLYRAEAHIDAYRERVLAVARQLRQSSDLLMEVIVVANEATEAERTQLERLVAQANSSAGLRVTVLHVARETLYASWNRGVRAAVGRCIGFWNVDDARRAGALIEAARRIDRECDLVEFPISVVRTYRIGGIIPFRWTEHHSPQYQPDHLNLKTRLGPFFLFSRALIERAGTFDGHFRIAGDFEWCARPEVRAARVCHGVESGGVFYLHGGNLSGTHSPLEAIEDAIVLLRHGLWDHLHPVDPDLLREHWTTWGDTGVTLPGELQQRMWGQGAHERWQEWERMHRRQQRARRLRALPRWVIDRTHTRDWLARLGIVQPSATRQP